MVNNTYTVHPDQILITVTNEEGEDNKIERLLVKLDYTPYRNDHKNRPDTILTFSRPKL